MAAIFLVLAVVDAALLANVVLANTSAGSLSVFHQLITRLHPGPTAAGGRRAWPVVLRCFWGLPGVRPAHGASSVGSCGWHDAAWRAGSPSWSARTHASARSWRARGAPARWRRPPGRRARRRSRPGSEPATPDERARVGARPGADPASGQELWSRTRRPSRLRVAPRPCPADPIAGEYGGPAPCGSGLVVPVCLLGWSEPGNQAKGGDAWWAAGRRAGPGRSASSPGRGSARAADAPAGRSPTTPVRAPRRPATGAAGRAASTAGRSTATATCSTWSTAPGRWRRSFAGCGGPRGR